MRLSPLSLVYVLVGSCCSISDDCEDGDFLKFTIIDSQGVDYLRSHQIDYGSDVRFMVKTKGSDRRTVYQDHSVDELMRADTLNSIIFGVYLTDEIEWVYFELDGTLRDSVTIDYSTTHDECCGNQSQIEATEYHQVVKPFDRFDTLAFTIHP